MRIEGFRLELKTTRPEHIKPQEDFAQILSQELWEQKSILSKPASFQRKELSPELKARIMAKVEEVSYKYAIPKELILAIIEQESAFNPTAYNRNKDGTEDRGLMQVNYQHNLALMKEYNITDPDQLYHIETNIELGARILYENYKRFGSWAMALKAYNGLRANNWDYVKKVLEKTAFYRSVP